MKCSNCGNIISQGDLFCINCGAHVSIAPVSINTPTPEIKPAKKPLKIILAIIIPIVIIAILAVAATIFLRGSDISYIKDSIAIFDDEDVVIVSGNNNAKFSISGKLHSNQVSLDRSVGAVLTDFDNDKNTGGTLWYVTPTSAVRIADEVVSFRLAESGMGVAYLTDKDNESNTATLYLYDAQSKKSTRITDDVYDARGLYYGTMNMQISPDGKTVAYVSNYDEEEKTFTG